MTSVDACLIRVDACLIRVDACRIIKLIVMKSLKWFLLFIPFMLLASCMSEPDGTVTVVKFDSIEPYLNNDYDTVYLINFWSVSNSVSMHQLKEIEKVRKEFDGEKVKILEVGLDPKSDKDSKVIPMMKKLGIHSDVMLLDDADTKSWRKKISPLWKGELPATIIYKGNSTEFYQEVLDYSKLKSIIDNRLKE